MPRPPSRHRRSSALAPAPAAAGHRPLLLAMALAAGFAALPAGAQPSGMNAIHGSAVMSQSGSTTTITTSNGANGHSAINWQSFNVPGGTTTHFAQPSAASLSINRVVAPNPSSILGTLSSNGHLVLVNPSGITVGAGAVVDTARFTASTLRMSDADAIAGRLRFDGSEGAPLRVEGKVLARGGDVVLIGQDVEVGAKAVIESPDGATILAAGQKVQLTGRGLEGIHFEVQAPGDKAVNLGTLKGDAVGIFAGTLRHSGLVQARAVTTAGGKVVLKAVDHAEVSGTITAQRAGGAGGSVDVLGATVGVMAGATIDTSNTAGGGQIRVGGDYKGQNPEVPNAQVTYVDKDATLRANATQQGDGGRIIVWADDTTRVHGTLEARGGPQGGNGGFIETSGKRVLTVDGARVTAAAGQPAGRAGTWVLDPADITIRVGGSTTATSPPFVRASTTEDSFVTVAALNQALAGGDGTLVLITTDTTDNTRAGNGDIIFDGTAAAGGPILLQRTGAGRALLTLDAVGDIVFRGSTTFEAGEPGPTPSPTPTPRRLDVVLNTGLRGDASRGVRTEAGSTLVLRTNHAVHDVELYLTGGRTWANEGTLTLNANGRITLADPDFRAATLDNRAGGVINGAAAARGGIGGYNDGITQAWGHLLNAGTIALAQGAIDVNGFTQSGGSTSVGDGGDFRARQSFTAGAGAFTFTGRDVVLINGSDLVLPAGSSIAATGSAFLLARQGNLTVQGGVAAAGNVSLVAEAGPTAGGSVRIDAPVSAGLSLALAADGRDTEFDAGVSQGTHGRITAAELLVYSPVGPARLTHAGNQVGSLAALAHELDLVNNADLLRIRPLEHEGIGGLGWSASGIYTTLGVRINNRALSGQAGDFAPGSIHLEPVVVNATAPIGIGIDAGGPVEVRAAGDLVLSAPVRTESGSILLVAGGDLAAYQASLGTAGGGIQLVAQAGGVELVESTVTSAGGAIQVLGGLLSPAPIDSGVVLWNSSLDAGSGAIEVRGRSSDPFGDGVAVYGAVQLNAAAGTLLQGEHTGTGAESWGSGVVIGDAALCATGCLTGGGALTVQGTSGSAGPAGVLLAAARIQRTGAVTIHGSGAGALGVSIDGSTVQTGGQLLSVSSPQGVSIHASSLATAGGNLTVVGGNSTYVGTAVDVSGGSSLHAGTGNVFISATTGEGTAFSFTSNALMGGLTISGSNVVITGSTSGGTALAIDNETITATESLTLTAINGGLEITDGSRVENTGTGLLTLQAQSSDPAAPAFLRVAPGATVTSVGSIRITADTVQLDAPLVSTGGRIEVVPLDVSRPITLGDGATAGTLNFSQASLDRLLGDTVFIGGDTFTGGIHVLSPVTVGGRTLSLVNQGAITQAAGARLSAGNLFLDAFSVQLDDVLIVDGGVLAGRARGGHFSVHNQSAAGTGLRIGHLLGLDGVSAPGAVTIRTGGALHLARAIKSDAGGNAITLVARSLGTETGGTLHVTDALGRWLAYLDAPTASLAGAPVSGNHAVWGTTHAATPPDQLAAAGNRYVFAQQPVVTIRTSALAKVYDGTAFATPAAQITGVVDAAAFGNVFNQDVVSASLAIEGSSKHVGTYAIVLASSSLPSGYSFSYQGAQATITQRDLVVGISAVTRSYDGTTDVPLVFTDNRVADDNLTVAATGRYADPNAGVRKTVTLDGLTLSGADAGNYRLMTPNPVTGTIERRSVSLVVDNLSKEQGNELPFKGTEFTIPAGDLVGNQKISSITLSSEGAAAAALAGRYTITGANPVGDAASGFLASNYSINITAGQLVVSAVAAPAVQQVQNAVNTFTALLTQEITAQQEQRAAVLAAREDAAEAPAPAPAAQKTDEKTTEDKKEEEKKDDKAEDKKKDSKDSKSAAKKRRSKEAIVSEESCKPA